MADDGMLLNFEIGDAGIKPQIKFKGGRWRDRNRAQNSAKRRQNADASTSASASTPLHEGAGASNRRGGGKEGVATGAGDNSERPTKRQKLGDGFKAQDGRPSDGTGSGHHAATKPSHDGRTSSARGGNQGPGSAKSYNVTSRLFSSNPTPRTVFEDAPVVETAEPVQPSNAPLSEEAANFHALGLSRRMAQHLSAKLEMKAPTAIQRNTIPQLVREDSDAFLQAETGSGKTLAYLLPIVQRIMALSHTDDGTKKDVKIHRGSGLFAIVLAPTRELCKQIATVLEKLLRCTPWIVSTTVIGGESKKSEKARIRKGVNILIATPGRLTDHLDHTEVLDVGTVRWLVLDEGDRLMEMGFEEDIRTIVGKIRKHGLKRENKDGVVLDGILPSRRVTVLCSATMKMTAQKLGEISLEDAVHITAATTEGDETAGEVNEAVFSAPTQLKQSYIIVPAKLRLVTLIALLKSTFARKGSVMKAIIFISCADSVDFHFDLLKSIPETGASASDSAEAQEKQPPKLTASTVAPAAYITSPANTKIVLHKLHGSLPQPVRTATLASFTAETDPAVLITTDISSRGLDVPAVDLVVEYDPAFASADHVHRIGRTARAGRPGKAVLFLMPGCEEGYISHLNSSSALSPQLYETVLQKGFSSPVELPRLSSEDDSDKDGAAAQRDKRTWTSRAESLQLHLEKRLLAPDESTTSAATANANSHSGSKSKGHYAKPKDSKLLEAARQAFRSHIRAYATHVREERSFFDIMQLHLGHTAKSFGLREAPGGIGGGIQRRTHRPSSGPAAKKGGAKRAAGSDDEDVGKTAADEDAARRMREKMRSVMRAADEFNIG